jgi:type II secretory pathway pseudopilin PulG
VDQRATAPSGRAAAIAHTRTLERAHGRTYRPHTRTPAPSPAGSDGFTIIEMLVIASLLAIVAGVAVPMTQSSLTAYRLSGDARGLGQYLGVARMRAAAQFTRTRVHVDLDTRRYFTETWNKTTSEWETDDVVTSLSSGVSFGFQELGDAPPDTQTDIGLSPECLDDGGAAIADTSCIIFNSRGVPVTAAGVPTGGNAFYLTDESEVYGATVSAAPLIQLWRTPAGSAHWTQQ